MVSYRIGGADLVLGVGSLWFFDCGAPQVLAVPAHRDFLGVAICSPAQHHRLPVVRHRRTFIVVNTSVHCHRIRPRRYRLD